MYRWRQMTADEREDVLRFRREMQRPWHGPPHMTGWQTSQYHLTAACYEHQPFIGKTPERMDAFAASLLATLSSSNATVHAWCLLPNHYHALVTTPDLLATVHALGRVHGRTSFQWNDEDGARGRRVWHRASDRAMRGERHFWASVNYIHHNPVRHRYVDKWSDWPWSSAHAYLAENDRDTVTTRWRDFPVLDYGNGWDDPAL